MPYRWAIEANESSKKYKINKRYISEKLDGLMKTKESSMINNQFSLNKSF